MRLTLKRNHGLRLVRESGKVVKLVGGWNPQVVCRIVSSDRVDKAKTKWPVDSELARRRFDIAHSERTSFTSVPAVGPSPVPRRGQEKLSSLVVSLWESTVPPLVRSAGGDCQV